MRIVRSRFAGADLESIWRYIAKDDPIAADGMIDRLTAATDRLRDFPLSSQDRSEVGPDLRSIPSWPYVIYFRVLDDRVQILRVVHGAQDVKGLSGLD